MGGGSGLRPAPIAFLLKARGLRPAAAANFPVFLAATLDDTQGGMDEYDFTDESQHLLSRSVELRKRMPHAVIVLVGICVIGYFVYHVIHGDRGLVAWRVLDQDVAEARSDLATVRDERIALERRVRLLRIESLDLDMVDEWARRILNYGDSDEFVIFTKDEDAKLLRGEPATPPGTRDDGAARVLGEKR